MHLRFGPTEKWVLDQTSIFAQVDAFVQRCKDLLEVSVEGNYIDFVSNQAGDVILAMR